MKPLTRASVLGLAALLVLPVLLTTRAPEILRYVKDRYRKTEVYIPMRDGTRLFTSIYVPRDRSQIYPIMLTRTPYSVAAYGPDAYKDALGPSLRFTEDGFIFAYQDVRGQFLSEGEFVDVRPVCADTNAKSCVDESTDAYDTIDWLVKHTSNNGRVGMWGVSYPGFYASTALAHAHPALKAASPQAPVTDWFIGEHVHHNGALYLSSTFNFFKGFGQRRPQPTTALLPPWSDTNRKTAIGSTWTSARSST